METEAFEIVVELDGLGSLEVKNFSGQNEKEYQFEVFNNGLLLLGLEPEFDSFKTRINPFNLRKQVVNAIINCIEAHYL